MLPEKIRLRDEEIFNNRAVFQEFQSEIKEAQKKFIQSFKRNNRRNQGNLEEYFAALVERHRKLLLVRVDLHYCSEKHPSIKQFNQNIEKLISRVQNKDTIFKDQVGYAYRLEQGGKSRGYHCHLLVIYNGTLRCNDGYLGMRIGELWQDEITRGDGDFYLCNQSEYKRSYQEQGTLGIGMIHRVNQREVNNAHAVISYLAKPEKDNQYLRGKLRGMREFGKGQLKKDQRKNHRSQKITDIHHLHEQ